MKIGYYASHENYSPSELLKLVVEAEKSGFQSILTSDDFNPSSEHEGQNGFAWSWLGAAMQATSQLEFGILNSPGQRYHPAIIAQACATLLELFPERFWIAIGSGQALNEHITGTGWPSKVDRQVRLKECADILNDLWSGKTVNKNGLVTVEDAKLFTIPATKPTLIGSAISERTAQWLGSWADGMITLSDNPAKLKKVIDAFRRGGGEDKPIYLKVQLSYARNESMAKIGAFAQWKNNMIGNQAMNNMRTSLELDRAGASITPQQLESKVLISSSTERHLEWLYEFSTMGFEKIFLHNVNRLQQEFIEDFGHYVIPLFLSIGKSEALKKDSAPLSVL